VGWLRSHLVKANREETINSFYFNLWDLIEGMSVRILKFMSAFLYISFLLKIKDRNKTEVGICIYTTFILLFFFGVHTLMEIQPRYLISPVIFTTIMMLYLHLGEFKEV
jgi:hypothetical protein